MIQIAQILPSLNFYLALVWKLFRLQLLYTLVFVGIHRLKRAAGYIGL